MALRILAAPHHPATASLDWPRVPCDAPLVQASLELLTNPSPNLQLPSDQEPANKTQPPANAQNSQDNADSDQMRATIEKLTAEVARLKRKVAGLEKERQVDLVQEQLTRNEQRAETLQAQLGEIVEKEAGLQTRLDDVNEQLRPENIERASAGAGSLRPEEVRDSLRRRLTNEKHRIQTQLDTLGHSRERLKASLADADAAVRRLRLRLDQATHP
jgi:chromosome segregation ATPase